MSLRVKISQDQLNRGKLVPPGKYSGIITSIDEDTDKNGGSMIIPEVTINAGEYSGVPIKTWMCPDWFGGGDLVRRFIESISGKPYTPDQEVDLSKSKGITVKFYVERGDNNGKPTNNIIDWFHKDTQ